MLDRGGGGERRPVVRALSAGDDQQITRWNLDGDPVGKVADLDEKTYVTDMSWFPNSSDTCAVVPAWLDHEQERPRGQEGEQRVSRGGHHLKWNYDGSAIATGARTGASRSSPGSGFRYDPLVQAGKLHSVAGRRATTRSSASGSMLTIKTLQDSEQKEIKWRAHDGTV